MLDKAQAILELSYKCSKTDPSDLKFPRVRWFYLKGCLVLKGIFKIFFRLILCVLVLCS